jgi:hypothetical protein
LRSHADGKKHKCRANVRETSAFLFKLAEILWTLKVVANHFSYNSCDGLSELFVAMFPDSEIAAKFSLGYDKVRYVLNFGLGPHFYQKLVDSLLRPGIEFAVSFDKSLNRKLRLEQMDMHVRYWQNGDGCAIVTVSQGGFTRRRGIHHEKVHSSRNYDWHDHML